VIKNLFRRPPEVGDAIYQAIYKLKVQRVRLEQVIVRLRERDRILFETCITTIKNRNNERALIFANELAEVRKLLNTVSQTHIVIERVILRLETIKELNGLLVELKPALKVLQGVAQCLDKVMPDMAYEMDQVNESISDALAISKVTSTEPIVHEAKTPASEEIMKEVAEFLQEKVAEKLPEPPISASAPKEVGSAKNVTQMVALTTGCSSTVGDQEQTSKTYVELQRLSLMVKHSSSLEDMVLEYAKKHEGRVDVMQCALELNASPRDIEEALEKLGAQGRVEIQG
jgi:division protein CdvB (Snf7/Vps24/ESCRT-III family)